MPETLAVSVQPKKYTVSAFPEGHTAHRHFALDVLYQGRGRWAVAQFDSWLGADGTWDLRPYEPREDWLDAHRFDFDTALRLAKEALPHVRVNGHSVADMLADSGR